MREPEPEAYYVPLAKAIEALGADWALAGALAAQRYRSEPRFTADADLLISWDSRIPQVIERAGWTVRTYADPGDPPHLIRARKGEEGVDLLVALTDYQKEALRRAVDHVLTVEDVIVHKIIAWRPRDRSDIQSIVDAEHQIDWAYVGRWAEAFGVSERIDELGIH